MNLLYIRYQLFFITFSIVSISLEGIFSAKQGLLPAPKKVVVIGTGAAGTGFVQEMYASKTRPQITWISADMDVPYNRTKLDSILSGRRSAQKIKIFDIKPENVQLVLGKKVVTLDKEKKIVTLSDGNSFAYDILFLATGSTPQIPVCEGYDFKNPIQGVFSYYSLHDVQNINRYIESNGVKKVVVLGAGITGLEAADAFYKRGLEVSLYDRNEHILSHYIDAEASNFIESIIKKQSGVHWHPKTTIQKIIHKGGVLQTLVLNNGTSINAQLLVSTVGVRPAFELARDAGLKIEDGAVVVDNSMRTSDPFIFAGGDIVKVYDQGTQMVVKSSKWGDALKQGKIAAQSVVGNVSTYEGAFIGYKTSFFGIDFLMSGFTKNYPTTHTLHVKKCADAYGKEFFHSILMDKYRLKGFVLINNTKQARRLRKALQDQTEFELRNFFSEDKRQTKF